MTLRATVNPENVPAKYQFSYGKTAAYGKAAPSTAGSLPPVSTPQQVSVHIGGLVPGTTYHYVLVADNSAGSSATTDTTFTTPAPPKVSTGSARRITPITATVAGTIIAGQAPTTACSFHFGRTKAYGSSVRCAWLPAPAPARSL